MTRLTSCSGRANRSTVRDLEEVWGIGFGQKSFVKTKKGLGLLATLVVVAISAVGAYA